MSAAALLEQFVESMETLPNNVKRGMGLMRKLDADADLFQAKCAGIEQAILQRAQTLAAASASDAAAATSMEALRQRNDPQLKELMQLYELSTSRAQEKIQVSYQLSDYVGGCLDNIKSSMSKQNIDLALLPAQNDSKRFRRDQMVSIHEGDTTILARIVRYTEETRFWVVADADDSNKEHFKTADQIIELLPEDVDFSNVPRYRRGEKVMALYPGTTAFYAATIVKPPKMKTAAQHQHFVVVQFDGDQDERGLVPERVIPVQLVYAAREQRAS